MDAPLDSLDSLASGYLQSAHFMRERIQLLTQYFSRSPVETPRNITILGQGPQADCKRKTFRAVALYFGRCNAGHIGFAHMLGGRRVQNSSWMWDKFVDEWPGIASGQRIQRIQRSFVARIKAVARQFTRRRGRPARKGQGPSNTKQTRRRSSCMSASVSAYTFANHTLHN